MGFVNKRFFQFEAPARRYIPRPIFSHILSGAERNASALANRAADGIIVSNHGDRQLDGSVALLRVLPGIVAEACCRSY